MSLGNWEFVLGVLVSHERLGSVYSRCSEEFPGRVDVAMYQSKYID